MESKKQKAAEEAREYLKIEYFELLRAKVIKGGVVFFDAKINGLTVYGMKAVPKKDGSGDFVAWPSYKAENGTFYNHVYAWLRPETEESILKAVQEKIDEE